MSTTTGYLILRGNEDKLFKKALDSILTDCPTYIIGNSLIGEYKQTPDLETPLVTGLYTISGVPSLIPIPSRGSVSAAWVSGSILNTDEIDKFTNITDSEYNSESYAPAKLLVKLNSTKHTPSEESNYTDLVKNRVFNNLRGKWAITLAYLSKRPLIVLMQNMCDTYFHIVYDEHNLAIVWSNEEGITQSLDKEKVFVYHVTPLHDKHILILHPLYLISKVKKWSMRFKTMGGRLMVIAALERYLSRNAQ